MVIDRLLEQGLARDWAICDVGVLPVDARMRDVMRAQRGVYTLVTRHPDGTAEARHIGSILTYLYAPDDPEAVIEQMAAPQTGIVSLTITEGGYSLDPTTGEFAPEDGGLVASVAAEFGVTDAWPVVAEPFFQWVLEDHFPAGRPPFEAAGVQLPAHARRALRQRAGARHHRQAVCRLVGPDPEVAVAGRASSAGRRRSDPPVGCARR
jgi:mannitol-1-phosphate/altronate dehydrogenase